MKTDKTSAKILKILVKDISIRHTITSLAKEISMSRTGVWKALKKLESDNLISLSQIGTGKTSIYSISLNWNNLLTEKNISLVLTEDAMKNQRWKTNFAEIENHVSFFILFGSILHNPKEANDIDILIVVDKKQEFKKVEEIISKIQKTQAKKIHLIDLTEIEFKQELSNKNKAYIDALKKGIILFGQDNFIKFIKNINKHGY